MNIFASHWQAGQMQNRGVDMQSNSQLRNARWLARLVPLHGDFTSPRTHLGRVIPSLHPK